MTDDMMALRSLLEKSFDADPPREMIGFTAQRLMELDVRGRTRGRLRRALGGADQPPQRLYSQTACWMIDDGKWRLR